MKKKQTKKQIQQKKKTQLTSGGQCKDFRLPGLSRAKIPIIAFKNEINKYLQKYPNDTQINFTKCHLNSLDGLEFPGEKVISIKMNYKINQLLLFYTIIQEVIVYQRFRSYSQILFIQIQGTIKFRIFNSGQRYLFLFKLSISKIEDLQHLNNFKKLQHLDLRFNPVKRYKEYRKIIFEQIPKLQNLDDDQEIEDSIDNSSRDNWLSSQVDDSESEASIDESNSSEDIKPKKKVKK